MDRGRETADFGGVTLDGRYRLGIRRVDAAHDGVHLPTGRRVIVRQAPGDTADAMRLKRTLQRVVALDHPAVVPVLDAGTGEYGLYLIEARIEGEPLSELCGQAQPPDRVADIVRQLARVLADAHGRGLVHGALRPECIILQQTTGRSDYVRVAGIGLSDSPFASGAGPWIAPEQRQGQPADARSDLYSMGLIGRALLGGLSPGEAAAGPLPGAPPRLVEVLDAICRRSPAQRPPSAVAVLGPIERASSVGASGAGRAMADTFVSTGPLPRLDAVPAPPGPPPPSARAPIDAPLVAPQRVGSPVVWLIAVVILLGVIAFLLLSRAGPPRDPAPEEARPAPIPAAAAPAMEAPPPTPDAAPTVDAAVAEPDAAPPEPDAAPPARPLRKPAPEPPTRAPATPRAAPAASPKPVAPAGTPPPGRPADYEKL